MRRTIHIISDFRLIPESQMKQIVFAAGIMLLVFLSTSVAAGEAEIKSQSPEGKGYPINLTDEIRPCEREFGDQVIPSELLLKRKAGSSMFDSYDGTILGALDSMVSLINIDF